MKFKLNLIKIVFYLPFLSLPAVAHNSVPLADQNPALFLDFSRENWGLSRTGDLNVKDLTGKNTFVGMTNNYGPVICNSQHGENVLKIYNSSIRQDLDESKLSLAIKQGEDFTVAGWYRFDPTATQSQIIFSQRGLISEEFYGPETSWLLNFDANQHGNSYYFIINRQTLVGDVTVVDPTHPEIKKVYHEQPNLYSKEFYEDNRSRQIKYNDYVMQHPSLTSDAPIERRNLNPLKPVQPGLPPELPTGPGGPGADLLPSPPIFTTLPSPQYLPAPYRAKDHFYMNHGFGGDSGADCWIDGEHLQCWHFIAVTYRFQDYRGPRGAVYFYRVNPKKNAIETRPPADIPLEPLEASRPINVRKNFFRLGENSSALFKDVAIYKRALDPEQVFSLMKMTAPLGKAYSCDYDSFAPEKRQ